MLGAEILAAILALIVVWYLVGYFQRVAKRKAASSGHESTAQADWEHASELRQAAEEYAQAAGQCGDDDERARLQKQADGCTKSAEAAERSASSHETQAKANASGVRIMIWTLGLMVAGTLIGVLFFLVTGLSFETTLEAGLYGGEESGLRMYVLWIVGIFVVLGTAVIPWIADEYAESPPQWAPPTPPPGLNDGQRKLYLKNVRKTNRRPWYRPTKQPITILVMAAVWGLAGGASFVIWGIIS